jgi:hypothetical protein
MVEQPKSRLVFYYIPYIEEVAKYQTVLQFQAGQQGKEASIKRSSQAGQQSRVALFHSLGD